MSNWKNHYAKLRKANALLTFAATIRAAAIVLLAATVNAHAQFKYTILGPPGTEGTQVYSISGNNIVGIYWYTNSGGEAFIYNITTGIYTPLEVPGTGPDSVTPLGIDGTNIVGLSDPGPFLYNGSTCTILNVPGYPLGISGNNIVGPAGSPNQGYLYNINSGTYTTFGVPGEQSTDPSGIDGTNIVGSFWPTDGPPQGFLYNGSTYTILSVPGSQLTFANGISGNNIVGSFATATSYEQAFVYNMSTSTYTALSVPEGGNTYGGGIFDGNLVGNWYDTNGYQHGFLATPTLYLQAAAVGGQFQLTVSGPSASAIVEASTNLLNWVPVCTNTPPFTFTDSAAALFPCRFYQAVSSQ